MAASILFEFEGLTSARVKTALKKVANCGFNIVETHVQVQAVTMDTELTSDQQQEQNLDIQPIQPNSIYLKCALLDSAQNYSGKGDITKIAKRRDQAPFIKLMAEDRDSEDPYEIIIPTESPIEDETGKFDLKVRKDIVFWNPAKTKQIGFYNAKANVLWISDLIHNPLRSEFLLDRAVSYIYEYKKCGNLNVITPIFDKCEKELTSRGLQDARLWWSGFENKNDTCYIDGRVDLIKVIDQDTDNLIKEGVDIFFMRQLKKVSNSIDVKIDKCEAKIGQKISTEGLQIPAYTTLEEELRTIEKYISKYAKDMASGFYSQAKAEFDAKVKK